MKPTTFTPGLIGVQFLPGGRVLAEQSPLSLLIAAAYGISGDRIEWPNTAPPMLDELYNINAKAPASGSLQGTPDRLIRRQLALMLQSLLADRFQLRLHHETKVLPVFILNVAKNDPRWSQPPLGTAPKLRQRQGHVMSFMVARPVERSARRSIWTTLQTI